MKSKAEIVRASLTHLAVLDIGGCGYGGDNAYEKDLRAAWAQTKSRTIVDISEAAGLRLDLNSFPLPPLENRWDITTAFDVLEHLENPTAVLRWIPTDRLILCLPNALSPFARRMEEKGRFGHRASYTPYTARVLVEAAGCWTIDKVEFTFGRWSWLVGVLNALASLWPSHTGTGIILYCSRIRSP